MSEIDTLENSEFNMSIISRPEFMVKVNKISEKFTEDREIL